MIEAAPAWVNGYVGLPFQVFGRDRRGVDCWGLVRLIAGERLDLDLPAYTSGYKGIERADLADIRRLIEAGKSDWVEIAARNGRDWRTWFNDAETVLREGDCIEVRLAAERDHVAYYVAPGRALHVMRGVGTAVMSYRSAEWRNRIVAFYRHNSRI